MKRILKLINKIPEEFHLSRRDFLLTIAVSVLSGIVFGMLKSPHKTQIIGCGNGNGTWSPEMEEAIFDLFKFMIENHIFLSNIKLHFSFM